MKKRKDEEESTECFETKKSPIDHGHTHTCIGNHGENPDHYCGDCHRWWGKKAS